jgi:NADH dehydrogenase
VSLNHGSLANSMNKGSNSIRTGSNVAIIGGGPAGCFFALYLLHYAMERGIQPEVTIYEQRNFDESGPKACKGCAGILSISPLRNLAELDMHIPEEIVLSKIEHYAVHCSFLHCPYSVHCPYTSITIANPEKGTQIASVYRGAGPRLSHFENLVSFDGWLLREAQKRGARVDNRTVSSVDLGGPTTVQVDGKRLTYDLVVLASGVNAKPIPVMGIDYVPPKTQIMSQNELYVRAEQVESQISNVAHAFLIPYSGLVFGTLVPKGPFVNVSVLSKGERPVSVTDFLRHDIVRSTLPKRYELVCGCSPRAAVGPACNYFADQFVAIGDASASRLYKDGIGSALLTAREAARTAVFHGISRQDFEHHYQPLCRGIERDNWWGRLLFSMIDRGKKSCSFSCAQQRLIGDEQRSTRHPQPFTKVAWGMFTGSYSYRSMARMVLSPASLMRFYAAFSWESLTGLFRRPVGGPRNLYVGSRKLLILGSGFGGTYALRYLVPYLNQNDNIETTMVSDENFFLFTPLLHEVAMGRIATRHISYPIRRLQWRDRFNMVRASIERIDFDARRVLTTAGPMEFDYLILALGSTVDLRGVQLQGGNIFVLKTLRDAMLIKNHIIGVFEQASVEVSQDRLRQLLTFVVCGAGYTGIQMVTELRDFIYRHLLRFYKTVAPDNIRIILVEASSRIVTGLHHKLGTYVMRELQQKGIEVRLRSKVTQVREGSIEINGTEMLTASSVFWVGGVVASPRVAELEVEKDSVGRVLVNKYMEVPGMQGVFAVGDCAHFNDPKTGQPVPPRAHIAVRQAKVVAHNILADIRGHDWRPYKHSDPPEMVSLGTGKAVFRYRGLRIYGLLARLIWLAGYSLLVTGSYNRTKIILDWVLSLIFGRDTTLIELKR